MIGCDNMGDQNGSITDNLDLRYMQIDISLQAGASLPGADLVESFYHSEFIHLIGADDNGFTCYLKFEFENPETLTRKHASMNIFEIKSQTKNSALVKAYLNGPIVKMFTGNDDVWWVHPTHLSSKGMTMTIRGTRSALKRTRDKLSILIGNGFTVKLGAESLHGPEFVDMLPSKQRIVLDKAIEMGYYSRPRGCTQRDIAEVMNIKQATVSEHLQSAESKIINSIRE